jgi:hypothetical protein
MNMASYVETGTRSDRAAGAIAQHLRVKTPGAVAVAGASDVSIGTMEFPCLAAGPCTIRLRSAQGTKKMVANAAITAGNTVYAANDGKVAPTGSVREGVAMESATHNNDVIEVMDAPHVDLVAAAGITLPTVTFNGLTTANKIIVPDNLADALSILEGSNKYLTVVTTNDGEKVQVNKPVELTSASATALAVGRQGTTNPALLVDASTGTSVSGLSVKSAASGAGVDVAAIGGTNEALRINARGSGAIELASASTGNVTSAVPIVVTSASANALAVGRQGTTAPALLVDASTATSITGVSVKSYAASGGVAVAAIGETNVNLSIDARGSGTINLGANSTGNVVVTRKATFANGLTSAAATVKPAADSGATSLIPAGVTAVDVAAVTTNADDWIVLPALADVPVGHTIKIACNAGTNFELRTPAASNEKINNVDSDGTQEYLCTDTDTIIIWKVSNAQGWAAQSISVLGAVQTAVVPD